MTMAADLSWVAMHEDRFALRYRNGEAYVEDVPLARIAAEVGTPTYVYSHRFISERYRAVAQAVAARPATVLYAVKANSNQAVLRLFAGLGAGADIVSGGELARALAARIPANKIVFSGVGKSNDEIDRAIQAEIRSLNAESIEEIKRIGARAQALGRLAPVTLRINPDVDPATHPYLATGLEESKFGLAMRDAVAMAELVHRDAHLNLVGLANHIGSQIVDVVPFVDAFARMRVLVEALAERQIQIRELDLGGGFGIAYGPTDRELDFEAWGRAVVEASRDLGVELLIEPGRSLVGQAGVMLTSVLLNKQTTKRSFVVVDAAMNDLLRPPLYGGYHAIVPLVTPPEAASVRAVDIVGPICESGDFLAKDRDMHPLVSGDLLAVLSAGAYGMTMASHYNTRPKPAEVMIHGSSYDVIRPRRTVEALIAEDHVPAWLESS